MREAAMWGCDAGGHPYARDLGTKLFLPNVLSRALLAFEPATAAMRSVGQVFTFFWMRALDLPKISQTSWHRDRIREELLERRHAKPGLPKFSETSDVLFTVKRAHYDGTTLRPLYLLTGVSLAPVYAYMIAKYTSRWCFFKFAAFACQFPNYNTVCEVVNPSKDHKVDEVAHRHNIDAQQFRQACRRLRQIWPLFP